MTGPMEYNERLIQLIDARILAAERKPVDFGTVQDRDTTGPGATVVLDGSTDASPVKVLGHVHCFGGDRVALMRVKGTWVVVGSYNRRQLQEANARLFGPNPSAATSSASLVDLPIGMQMTFSKRYDLTAVRIMLATAMTVTAQPTVVQTAVRIAGAPGTATASSFTPIDVSSGQFNFNVTGTHLPIVGMARTTGMPAGDYIMTPRWRRVSGAGNPTIDFNDLTILEADEIFRNTEV